MQRKLTVIVVADIAGYTGLMVADETGTMERLRANRAQIFDPAMKRHGGRVLKLLGDGALTEFSSAVAAVECALEIQAATEEAAANLPENRRLRYRIGINLGEVVVEDDDIYGEGVNAAARLQTLAPVGGIAVSRLVVDQVDGKIACSFEDIGEHRVKEHERAIHAFAVRAARADRAQASREAERAQRPSVCVLPFTNMSGDAEQEYFSDGVTEDIITDLSKVSALWIAARNTAFQFKGKNVDVPQLARQLNVSHVLEGSVRKAGGRVRITAQLIDASGGHVWAERYDRDLDDIFALQDEISEAIVGALKVKLLPDEKKALERRDTENPEAYELFLMARQFDRSGSERMRPLIVRLCQRAVTLDPAFARAYALIASAEAEAAQRAVPGLSYAHAKTSAERAIALAPTLAEAHAALGEVHIRGGVLDLDAAQAPVATALKLDPNCYEAHVCAGYLCLARQRYEDGIRHFEAAIALDSGAYRPAGMVLQLYEKIGDAEKLRSASQRCIKLAEKLLAVEPDHGAALGFMVSALAQLGEGERAREWARRAVLFDPDNLRMHYNVACGLATLKDADGAIGILEAVVPNVDGGWLRWMATDNSLDPIRDDARYKALVAARRAELDAEGGA